MRLVRFGDFGSEKPGVFTDEGLFFDVSEFCRDFDESFFAGQGIPQLKEWFVRKKNFLPLVPDDVRLGPPVTGRAKLMSIRSSRSEGLGHASKKIEPRIFFKSAAAIVGAEDSVIVPRDSERIFWEVELAVVIGKTAIQVAQKDAMSYVAGYCMHNNYTTKPFHLEKEGQLEISEELDTFSALGPYLVTPDEIENIDNLYFWAKVNGKLLQIGNTSSMVLKVPFLISYLSQFTTLLPGDIISTGAALCGGTGTVADGQMKAGDAVELSIERLGYGKQHVVKSEGIANHKFLDHFPSRAMRRCQNY